MKTDSEKKILLVKGNKSLLRSSVTYCECLVSGTVLSPPIASLAA